VTGAIPAIPYKDIFTAPIQINEDEKQQLILKKLDAHVEEFTLSLENIQFIIDEMATSIIKNEVPFCELDAQSGDGDFGMSVAKGFKQLRKEWVHLVLSDSSDIGTFLQACSLIIMEHCGGASGPIWGSAFRAAGKKAIGKNKLSVAEMAELLQAAVEGIQLTGKRSFGRGAVVGDKTLIDALVPCVQAWEKSAEDNRTMKEAFAIGAEAACEGAKATKEIVARMGRAGTAGERSIGYPDAGAHALGIIFTDIAEALQ